MTFDIIYKIFSLIIALGILGGVWRVAVWAIRLEPRIVSLERQVETNTMLIQKVDMSISHIEGQLNGFSKWDGHTERRKTNEK